MRLRIPNGFSWAIALTLGISGCSGDSNSPTSPSSQPGPSSTGNFSLSLQVSNSNARASTAANASLGWAQRQDEDEVKVEVLLSETGGQTGGTINDVSLNTLNANGRVTRTETIDVPITRLAPGQTITIVYGRPRLNSNAETVEAVARVTSDSGATTTVSDQAPAPFPKNCANGETNACLNNGRFSVRLEWTNADGESGVGHKVSQRDYRGVFWFFNPDNVDLIVDVLNGCSSNNHFWVFTAGTTNVELDLTVTDTMTGDSRVYSNPLNGFEPIADTSAFATCP